MKYAWIRDHRHLFSLVSLCKVFGVSRSCYYAWCQSILSQRARETEGLKSQVKSIFTQGRENYGSRRIRNKLISMGFQVSRRRVRKLMKEQNLNCKTKRKFKVTTDSKHSNPVAPNILDRKFEVAEPNKAFVGDITYIWTAEGWLYLAIVLDLFSRRVVGWSMNERMKASLVNDALTAALWKRKPNKGLVWHTDRGSQYASDSHRELIASHEIIQSMSRKGNCWDNSVAESFFKTLKIELVYHCEFKTRAEARQMIFEYIEVFYNRERLHSANGYMSPVEYENNFERLMKKVS